MMEKSTIITLKNQGKSNREVSKITGIDRKTVARYWKHYQELIDNLYGTVDLSTIQEEIITAPKYDSSAIRPRKYNQAIDARINGLLAEEEAKDDLLDNRVSGGRKT